MQKFQEGIYLVDKPSGPTSHNIVAYFRRKSGIKKVGHCGTLDPLASGLLIILVGREFTKKQSLYLKKDKSYLATARLGITTDSYDIEGNLLSQEDWKKVVKINKTDLEKTLIKFQGEIEQTVPIFSAVKVNGQKLYEKARKGETNVELPKRKVRIKEIKLINFDKDLENEKIEFTLEVAVSSGTYIRSLIHEIGQNLGVGATVNSLRRTEIDNFHVKNAITLDDFHVKKKKDDSTT
jgi:tRNA pseudouridine55 synthase